MLSFIFAQVKSLDQAAPAQSLTQDSAVLGEQFYFFTVVLMWLIHAGFMSYEAGVARRKNVMATAMKNILTIAVVTPTFYYFGWWVYNCNQAGPADRAQLLGLHLGRLPGRHPVERRLRAEPDEQHQPDLLPGLPALLVDDGLDPVGRDHRAGAASRPTSCSPCILGSVVWILDAAWGWSAGGWMTLRFGFHDSIASAVVHGVAGAFTLGVLFNVGPRIGKYTKDGLTRVFRPHNLHITALGLMLIFTGFYAFYGACLVIASTSFPGWANIYLSPTTLGSITMVITMGFAGGFTGGYFASRGDPFWTISGGLAGVIGVSAGADVYAPTLALADLDADGRHGRLHRAAGSRRRCASTTRSGRWPCTAARASSGSSGSASSPPATRRASTTSRARIGGQLIGMATFLPLGFLSGWVASCILKKLNLLRVPRGGRARGPGHGRVRDRLLPRARPRARGDRRARRHARPRRRCCCPRELAALTNGHLPGPERARRWDRCSPS